MQHDYYSVEKLIEMEQGQVERQSRHMRMLGQTKWLPAETGLNDLRDKALFVLREMLDSDQEEVRLRAAEFIMRLQPGKKRIFRLGS
ncbi:hypothetical protein [Paenibacillus sp. OSY-SE]|uniref:hypothetical protein n=1 Tax=Paenibacillus sp. OSY-SE TaxID=1196323 RepID=UPI00030C7809|nr:hypothetical protein [Paenibacillus sp. OSY-SE]